MDNEKISKLISECSPDSVTIIADLVKEIERYRNTLQYIKAYAEQTHSYFEVGNSAMVEKRLLTLAGLIHTDPVLTVRYRETSWRKDESETTHSSLSDTR